MTGAKGIKPMMVVAIILVVSFYVFLTQSPLGGFEGWFTAKTNLVERVVTSEDTNISDEDLEKMVLDVASNYKSYGLVDDEARWAPWLCRMPMPAVARFSKSEDEETHGEKLYLLYAKNRGNYMQGDKMKPEVGQVVVKESWRPVEVEEAVDLRDWRQVRDATVRSDVDEEGVGNTYIPIAEKDGQAFKTGEFAGLYIMAKLDPETEGTDEGWIYATVSDDLETITAIGKIDSCINCHQDAPHDRLFGLKN